MNRRIVSLAVACAAAGIAALAACVAPAKEASASGRAEAKPPVRTPATVSPGARISGPADFAFSGELTQGGWIRGTVPGGTARLTLDGAEVPVAADGQFFVAFDRDAASSAALVATLRDGRRVERRLAVSPRAWRIEHINVARKPGGPTEEFMQIRKPELARINAAREINADSDGWRQRFVWPVKGRISGLFGSQRIYRGEPGAYHSGLDIAGGAGTAFVAPADGVVILAAQAPFSLEGNLLMIDHGNGLNSAFLHCSTILVHEGERVRQGQVIGRIGATGRATGPHLHWSLKWRDARLDPLLFTGPMP